VPDSIGQLKNLKSLDLSNNKIEKLPGSIQELKNLKEFYIYDNNLSSDEKEKIKRLLPNTKIYF
jgi:Leucine-rich repeat (LRR) protein